MGMGSILAFAFLAFALVTLFKGVVTVSQSMEYTIERFGKYRGTFGPGLHWLIPFVDRVARRIPMMEQVLDVPTQEVITKDNAMVAVDGVVFYQVLDAAKAAYEIHNLEYAIAQLAQTNARLSEELGVAQRAAAEHARTAGEQATELKVGLAVAQQQLAALKAECAQWQKLHAQEAARARQLEAELQLLRSASSASKQPANSARRPS